VNEATLEAIHEELRSNLVGRRFGAVFALSKRRIAIDFRLPDSRYLFISAEPKAPKIYLVRRRFKDLERSSGPLLPFHLLLRKYLSGTELEEIFRPSGERIFTFTFSSRDEPGKGETYSLTAQLTGRSANLFLLDDSGIILDALVDNDVPGQQTGDKYVAPKRSHASRTDPDRPDIEFVPDDRGSISAALDRIYTEFDAEERFRARARAERKKLQKDVEKRRKLLGNLSDDLVRHGDAEQWKRYGDLILANLSTAERAGNKLIVTDYFDDLLPQVEIEVDENMSLTVAAQKFFRRYTKAQNAAIEIRRRMEAVNSEIDGLERQLVELDQAIEKGDRARFPDETERTIRPRKKKEKPVFSGARRFVSSDGYEILVGKRAQDNDYLTFRTAGSLDLWLHAADYPGSHVIVRNPNRKEIPHRTLSQAAQLAAFYSSGRSQTKAAVNYTQKKFVNKPKGAAAGLVWLSSFKTILVKPAIPAALAK
jgi:predicted ribosome quality control (RQC) complex YloA/Tae2 family protein